jgi:diaminohydroxyphosphoribosylaminopyrimidine deaminase/5-amino-6-(5-phosphoribosylamino)uracil reductase
VSDLTDQSANERELWQRLVAAAAAEEPLAEGVENPFWQLYAPIALSRGEPAFVVAQLGQSLDGRIATGSGHSHYVNGPQAIAHVHRLRALVDAVVVGIGTVVADDPRLTVREVQGRNPARVVIDPRARLPATARLLAGDGSPVYVIQAADHPRPARVKAITLAAQGGRFDPRAVVEALAREGFRRLLIEGGAVTVSSFLAAGLVDRLHLCVAPMLIGSGLTGINLPIIDRLEHALRPKVTLHRLGEDCLFDCELRAASPS